MAGAGSGVRAFTLFGLMCKPNCCIQLRIEARDGGDPPCVITTLAVINVRRNLQRPRFRQDEFTTTILETHPLATAVSTVTGEDNDERVSGVTSVSTVTGEDNDERVSGVTSVITVTGEDNDERVSGVTSVITVTGEDND